MFYSIVNKLRAWYRQWQSALNHFAARKSLVIVALGCIPIVVNPLFSLFMGIPHPQGTDEFGYLLMADTFTHCRIANPSHPLWRHFETFAEIETPTRSAISPPMQGLFLSIGQALFHCPIAGVWLSIGLMCAAIAWMLYGWLRPPWALIGSFIALCNCGLYTYWSHTYWGGAPAAIGGSLVFGALPRLLRKPSVGLSSLLGLGCCILANSRPLEGFIVCLPVAGVLVVWLLQCDLPLSQKIGRVIAPIVIVMSLLMAQTAFFNKTITGSPFVFPETLAIKKLSSVPLFLWQKPRPEPAFSSRTFKDCEEKFTNVYYTVKRSSIRGFLFWSRYELIGFSNFYLGTIPLLVMLFAIPYYLKHRKQTFAFGIVMFLLCIDALCLSIMTQPNYFAPIASLLFLLVAIGFRRLSVVRIRQVRIGRKLVPTLLLLTIALSAGNILVNMKRPAFRPWKTDQTYSRGNARAALIERLKKQGGKHLVIVRYGPLHDFAEEWVYNGADIDGSPVVLARELDGPSTMKLCDYFTDRSIWLLNVDDDGKPPRLTRY
jgi:hypothetical protein